MKISFLTPEIECNVIIISESQVLYTYTFVLVLTNPIQSNTQTFSFACLGGFNL